jgi:FMN-dependent NADH-azoreductase
MFCGKYLLLHRTPTSLQEPEMILLRVDSSIRDDGSVSRAVADSVQAAWLAEHPDGRVITRELGLTPLPIESWPLAATAARGLPVEQWTDQHKQAVALAEQLVNEVLSADAFLVTAPLYNFGVPATLKIWLDLLFTRPELSPYGDVPLAGKPAVLVVARGGGYGEGTPRAGWDHSTPWLQRVFGEVFKLDLRTIEAELTLAESVPAMEGLRELARQVLADAHTDAERHGREIARQAIGSAV